jgi:aryl-alcohol dehydrogenase-like predicted oxidoreductase
VASLQPPYSLLNRDIEKELLPYCAANNIGVIAYSPMQSGLLTGKFTRKYVANLAPTDWRLKVDPNFRAPRLSANLAFVERMRPIAERNSQTVGQLAIAWALRRQEVTAVIVGAHTPAQFEELAPAGDWTLSADDSAEIEALLRAFEEEVHD